MTDPGFAGMVDVACHDLRTPLATVNGFTKTILRAGEVEDIRYVEAHRRGRLIEIALLVVQLGLAARDRVRTATTRCLVGDANTLELAPSAPAATNSDVGAIVARTAVEALGGSVELDGETLRVRI
jgi:signal transduction histidine kinase